MNKQQYDHIVTQFNLDRRNEYMSIYEYTDVGQLYTYTDMYQGGGDSWIVASKYERAWTWNIFVKIPSKSIAEEIIQYIKDTEILFV